MKFKKNKKDKTTLLSNILYIQRNLFFEVQKPFSNTNI